MSKETTRKKYKNNTKQDLTIPGIGIVKAGEVVEVEGYFNNSNFILLGEEKKDNK